jgi:hypothetical protein
MAEVSILVGVLAKHCKKRRDGFPAADPAKAVSILKGRVGIKLETSAHQPERLLDREAVFAGWKLRLVDRERKP